MSRRVQRNWLEAGPVAAMLVRRGWGPAEAADIYADRFGVKVATARRLMFRIMSGRYRVDFYNADRICTMAGSHLAIEYGKDVA